MFKLCCTILVMGKALKKHRKGITAQILVGVIGFILSLALHELFHIAMHWNQIDRISLFPTPSTIVQIDVTTPPENEDIDGEEMTAYGITLLVMLITVITIYRIRDTEDNRTVSQILFPGDRKMQKLTPSQLLRLSGFDDPEPKRSKRNKK